MSRPTNLKNEGFIKNLRELMRNHGETPAMLARAIDLERQSVYGWLRTGKISPRSAKAVCDHYGVTMAELLYSDSVLDAERLAGLLEVVESNMSDLSAQKRVKIALLLYSRNQDKNTITPNELEALQEIAG